MASASNSNATTATLSGLINHNMDQTTYSNITTPSLQEYSQVIHHIYCYNCSRQFKHSFKSINEVYTWAYTSIKLKGYISKYSSIGLVSHQLQVQVLMVLTTQVLDLDLYLTITNVIHPVAILSIGAFKCKIHIIMRIFESWTVSSTVTS